MQSGDSTIGIGGYYAFGIFHDWDRRIVCSREILRLGWEDCMQLGVSTPGMRALYAVERFHNCDGNFFYKDE